MRAKLACDPSGCGLELWCGAGDRAGDQVCWPVSGTDVGQPLVDRHALSVRSCRHVAIDQRVSQVVWRGLELAGQLPGETSFSCLDDGAGMVGDQPAEHGLGVLDIAQVPRAIKGMEPGVGQPGRVADVVQDGGGREQVGVLSEDRSQGPGRLGDPLYVRPAARQ